MEKYSIYTFQHEKNKNLEYPLFRKKAVWFLSGTSPCTERNFPIKNSMVLREELNKNAKCFIINNNKIKPFRVLELKTRPVGDKNKSFRRVSVTKY